MSNLLRMGHGAPTVAMAADVRADDALPIAGIALAIFSLQRRSDTKTVLGYGDLRPRFRS